MKSASILVLLTIWLLPPTIVSAQFDDLFIGKRFEKIKEISFMDSSSKVSKPSLLMKFYLNDQGYVFRGESFSDEKVVSWSEIDIALTENCCNKKTLIRTMRPTKKET